MEELRKRSAALRKSLYGFDERIRDQLPDKYEGSDLGKEMEYVERLIEKVKTIPFVQLPVVYEKMNFLAEAIDDIKDHYTASTRWRCRASTSLPDEFSGEFHEIFDTQALGSEVEDGV